MKIWILGVAVRRSRRKMNKRRVINIGILLLISIITILFLYLKDIKVKQYMLNNNKFDLKQILLYIL